MSLRDFRNYHAFQNANGDWYAAHVDRNGSHGVPGNFGSWNTFRTRAQAVAAAKRENRRPLTATEREFSNPRRKNPTKAQKREKARKASVQRRVAVALAKFLKLQNPSAKISGAELQKLKGGVLKITPIKANASIRKTKKAMKKGNEWGQIQKLVGRGYGSLGGVRTRTFGKRGRK